MRRSAVLLLLLLVATFAPRAAVQVPILGRYSLHRLNRDLGGQVVDYTNNHGEDRRIRSAILGEPRDLYVYLPPGYDPHRAYPLLVYLHISRIDEQVLLGSDHIRDLDSMIRAGLVPPLILICPDGVITGGRHPSQPHSLNVNGVNGRFEDHILYEVIPFVTSHYPVLPNRASHAILGASAGGYGAFSMALRHREFFGVAAAVDAPLNLLYDNLDGDPLEDFNPATFRWKPAYEPREVIGRFAGGLVRLRARTFVEPVFGSTTAEVLPRVQATNPASLIAATGLAPGEMALYVGYAGRDQFNFDAHAQSFAWLAAQQGVPLTLDGVSHARHNQFYFSRAHDRAFAWLGQNLTPRAARSPAVVVPPGDPAPLTAPPGLASP